MTTLTGRKAIITGGGSGIGAAIARRFVADGALVAVLDRDVDATNRVAEQIGAAAVECNVASSSSVGAAFEEALGRLGGLTDLVNNAGFGMNKPLHTYSDDEWDLVVGVNLTGPFLCLREAVPSLRATGRGSVVNVSSLNALRPLPGEAPYSAAKAGLVNLTMTAAQEYAPDIRVNCVSPGLIDTPLTAMVTANPDWLAAAESGTPLARVGTAEEVAAVVAFLASDDAAYITGQNVVIDGGAGLPSLQADGLVRAIMNRR